VPGGNSIATPDIKIKLNGEDVSRAIADAIVKSRLGDIIVKMTNDYLQGLSNSEVRKQLAEEIVAKIVTAAVTKFEKSIYNSDV
jgi:hypothetical protein